MSWQLAVDAALIVMLALAVVVIIRFERQLALARRSQHELDRLAATFRDATARAEDGIGRLKDQAATQQQQHRVAVQLASDLQDLIERGTTLADRLEATVRHGRTPPLPAGKARTAAATAEAPTLPPSPAPGPGREMPLRPDIPPRSAAERALLQALQASGLVE
jgi:chorismate-pyruvate lyase